MADSTPDMISHLRALGDRMSFPYLTDAADRLEALTGELGRVQRELDGVRESLAERARACDDAEATVAMYRTRLARDRGVPDWAVPVLGPAESSLRVLNAIWSRTLGGETRESIADDYAVDPGFVDLVNQRWDPEP